MTIQADKRFSILERDGFRCRYCGKLGLETELEVDHVKPRAKGGSDADENLVACCRPCNAGKRDRAIEPPGRWTSLRGKFFHSFCEGGLILQQGRVLEVWASDYVMVQLFEWLSGSASFTGTRLVSLERIEREQWALYSDAEDMQESYEYSGRQHRESGCVCQEKPKSATP